MTERSEKAKSQLINIWASDSTKLEGLANECNPNKICKNMAEVGFSSLTANGLDFKEAWREILRKDGKLR